MSAIKATHTGMLRLGEGTELPCFVLEGGKRLISGRGLTGAIGMRGRGQGASRITSHPKLKSCISEELSLAINNPIHFYVGGLRTSGYEATILHGLCEAILTARDQGFLVSEQELRYAAACESLIRSFAKVGIIALIDEATGYQAERARDALAQFLSLYLVEERLRWARIFPEEFYKQMYRLMRWDWPTGSRGKTPYVGKLTNEIVYERLPLGVLEELKVRNPVIPEKKRRAHTFTQFMSEDIGQKDLKNHLFKAITLMQASTTWGGFISLLDRVAPKGREVPLSLLDD